MVHTPAGRSPQSGPERVLFLGNSIALHGPVPADGWPHHCGMAASIPEHDYVHLVVAALEARTGTHLWLSPEASADGSAPANVLNIADLFERNYAGFTGAALQAQLDWQPDLVVLQCGENVVRETFAPEPFRAGLRTLLAALQAAGTRRVFVTSQILGAGGPLDGIKRDVCAEDPVHRVYVDLGPFHEDPANFASAEPYYTGMVVGHPGDRGMARIADGLLAAILGA